MDRVPEALARALAARGYIALTPVQQEVVSTAPGCRDMLVSARTGSGKTVAFGLAVGARLLGADGRVARGTGPRAMILTPTRELARQVGQEFAWLYAGTGARTASFTGGADMRAERAVLAGGVEIVVGSPGRLRDHITRGTLAPGALECVVLDEADDLLDMGFRDDLQFLLEAAPPERQTLMFSATTAPPIEALARRYLRSPVRIDLRGAAHGRDDITYQAMVVTPRHREAAIVNVLRLREPKAAIVFCARREAVGQLAGRLCARGFDAVALSGALSQAERNAAIAAMRLGRARICVATDVAARGLDLPGCELVLHADLPLDSDTLVHRSGRTGRAGRKGLAVLVALPGQRRRTESLTAQAGIVFNWVPVPGRDTVLGTDRVRMLSDPALTLAASADERESVAGLMAEFPPLQLAVAVQRLRTAGLPQPEAIDDGPYQGGPRPGHWFSVNLGCASRGDIRRVLRLVCRLGEVTRGNIGRIRMHPSETEFEVNASVAAGFTAAVMRNRDPDIAIRCLGGDAAA